MTADGRLERNLSIALAVATVLFHLLTARVFGYFRDELYYLACANHLGLGYVDHPPLVAWITWLARAILGESQLAIRVLPAVAAGATVWLTMRMTRALGGLWWAQALAGICVALAPDYVAVFGILSMNAYDVLIWTAIVFVLVHIFRTGETKPWLLFGLLAGVGLQNKISVLFLGFGLAVGLLLARQWKQLGNRWFWLGGTIAGLIFLPHLLWQVAWDWPTLEFMRNATQNKNLPLSPLSFLGQQVLMMNPATLPVWGAGLGWLLFARAGKPYRTLGLVYLVVLVLLISQRSKAYYLGPAYPMLFAAGALFWQGLAAKRGLGWLRPVWLATVLLTGALLAPLAKPILPLETYIRYAAALGQAPATSERKEVGRLGQFYADRFGWPELAAAVADVYDRLPPEDQREACVYSGNYGQAGAIELFGADLGLPTSVAGHNSYHLWGPQGCSGRVMIVIGADRDDLEPLFESIEHSAQYSCADCMPYESDKAIWVARGLQVPLDEQWPRLRHFD